MHGLYRIFNDSLKSKSLSVLQEYRRILHAEAVEMDKRVRLHEGSLGLTVGSLSDLEDLSAIQLNEYLALVGAHDRREYLYQALFATERRIQELKSEA